MSDLANPGPRAGTIWRMVEAQHRVSTMKLIDDADEQHTLEELLDASKPPVPAECASLHYLLFTPFRYEARADSRFRRAGATPPVFYAAEQVDTAVAEITFWRLLFFPRKPGNPVAVEPARTDRLCRGATRSIDASTSRRRLTSRARSSGAIRPITGLATPSPMRRATMRRVGDPVEVGARSGAKEST